MKAGRFFVSPVFQIPAMLFMLSCMASPAAAQPMEIQGKIINGTHQNEGSAEQVSLLALGQGMQELSTLKDVRGSFKFPLAADAPGPFLIRATYRGVNYFKAVGPFQAHTPAQHDVTVYDQIDNLDKASIRMPHVFIKRDQDQLAFNWNFEVNNPTSTTMFKPGGLFQVGIPEGVESLNITATSGSGMPLRVALTKNPKDGSFFVNYAIKPGKTNIEISYGTDYSKENYALQQRVFYPLSKVVLLIYPEDLQVESEGLHEMQVDATNHVKIAGWDSLAAGSVMDLKIQGGSKIAAPPEESPEDRQVVEKPPAMAKAQGLLWGLMALGFGLNIFLFLNQKSTAAGPTFEFSGLSAYREKFAALESQRKTGALDAKTWSKQKSALIQEAWKAYLDETHGN